jgi:hypothetical protein
VESPDHNLAKDVHSETASEGGRAVELIAEYRKAARWASVVSWFILTPSCALTLAIFFFAFPISILTAPITAGVPLWYSNRVDRRRNAAAAACLRMGLCPLCERADSAQRGDIRYRCDGCGATFRESGEYRGKERESHAKPRGGAG